MYKSRKISCQEGIDLSKIALVVHLIDEGAVKARIREEIDRRGLLQKTVAAGAGITQERLSRLLREGGSTHPEFQTVAAIAAYLKLSLDELAGLKTPDLNSLRPEYRELVDVLDAVAELDRRELLAHASWTARRLGAETPNVIQFRRPEPASSDEKRDVIGDSIIDAEIVEEGGDFPEPPIPPEEYIEKDGDRPRPLHAWLKVVEADIAAGPPRNPDDILLPSTHLLNSLREVRDDRIKVIKIFGDSMHPILRNGWKVLMDPARGLFKPGRIVVVYIKDEGQTMGLLSENENGGGWYLKKRNSEYPDIPLKHGEWYPVGTITTIVEAPVEIE